MTGNPLGQDIPTPSKYDPGILYPIPRWAARSLLDIDKKIKMYGIDHWHAYELSWLNMGGKPETAVAEFFFDSDSENIVESKSLKMYLHSFNQERLETSEQLQGYLQNDLSAVSKSDVKVVIQDLDRAATVTQRERSGRSLDRQPITVETYHPDEELLSTADAMVFDEQLYSDLFKSNCPVTGAPDWASFAIRYTGLKIDEAGLLAYLCSFRLHQAYHEDCAERIFRDIMQRCQPTELHLALNFVRRGGLDINVYRSSVPINSDSVSPRLARQ